MNLLLKTNGATHVWIKRYLVGVLMLFMQSLVFASPTYQFSRLPWGDTAGSVDINDYGVIVFSGFGDNGLEGNSKIVGGDIVQGFGYLGVPYAGVSVSAINNAGDMYGTAIHNGIKVPTIWIDGVPYDLTEPENSGMTFNADPGPKWVNVDLWALDVLGEPFVRDPYAPPCCNYVLTNQRGDYVAAFNRDGYNPPGTVDVSYALLRKLPEPATLFLVVVALLGLAATRRRGTILMQRDARPQVFNVG